MTSKKYFDASNRDLAQEKRQNLAKSLKSNWKTILNESVKPKDQKLLKEAEEPKLDEPEVTPDGDTAPTDVPTDAPVGDEADPNAMPTDTPAPVDTDAPVEGGAIDAESQMKVDSFIQKTLANLPTEVELKSDANGIFKAVVADDQNGSFTIAVYPTDKYSSIHDVANLIEPKDEVPVDADTGGDMPPVDSVVPPVEGAGDIPPASEGAGGEDPAPVEEPIEDEEINEQKLEESRFPTSVGKKDWSSWKKDRYSKKS